MRDEEVVHNSRAEASFLPLDEMFKTLPGDTTGVIGTCPVFEVREGKHVHKHAVNLIMGKDGTLYVTHYRDICEPRLLRRDRVISTDGRIEYQGRSVGAAVCKLNEFLARAVGHWVPTWGKTAGVTWNARRVDLPYRTNEVVSRLASGELQDRLLQEMVFKRFNLQG